MVKHNHGHNDTSKYFDHFPTPHAYAGHTKYHLNKHKILTIEVNELIARLSDLHSNFSRITEVFWTMPEQEILKLLLKHDYGNKDRTWECLVCPLTHSYRIVHAFLREFSHPKNRNWSLKLWIGELFAYCIFYDDFWQIQQPLMQGSHLFWSVFRYFTGVKLPKTDRIDSMCTHSNRKWRHQTTFERLGLGKV